MSATERLAAMKADAERIMRGELVPVRTESNEPLLVARRASPPWLKNPTGSQKGLEPSSDDSSAEI